MSIATHEAAPVPDAWAELFLFAGLIASGYSVWTMDPLGSENASHQRPNPPTMRLSVNEAEGEGFESSIRPTTDNGFESAAFVRSAIPPAARDRL